MYTVLWHDAGQRFQLVVPYAVNLFLSAFDLSNPVGFFAGEVSWAFGNARYGSHLPCRTPSGVPLLTCHALLCLLVTRYPNGALKTVTRDYLVQKLLHKEIQ